MCCRKLEEFVKISRSLVGIDLNIDKNIIAIKNRLLSDIIEATNYKQAVEATGGAILYFKEKYTDALRLAIAGRNAFMLNKWLVNNVPITIGSYNKVHVHVTSKISLVGYPWLCHVGDKSLGSRAFLLDPLVTMINSMLPGSLKGSKIKITEVKESRVMTSPCVTLDIMPANSLIKPFSVHMGTIEGLFIIIGSDITHPYFHGFFEKVYKAYTQVTARSLRIRYPTSLSYCWSCHKMASCQVCSGCGCARYCSNLCRHDYWPTHKLYCNKTVSFTIQF